MLGNINLLAAISDAASYKVLEMYTN